MIEVNDKMYELKYNMRVLEQIEKTLDSGIMHLIQKNNGLMGVTELKVMFGFGLFTEEGKRIAPAEGMNIAEELMIKEGYDRVNELVITSIDKDLPFLFQVN